QEQRGVGVAEVVQRNARDRKLGDLSIEGLAEGVRVNERTVLLREDEVVVARLSAGTLLGPLDAPELQHVHGAGVEVDRASPRPGLHVRELHLVRDRDKGLTHGQPTDLEIDVAPRQTEYLTAPHPGVRRQVEGGVQTMRRDRIEERGE